jgi:hypothetical protein
MSTQSLASTIFRSPFPFPVAGESGIEAKQ